MNQNIPSSNIRLQLCKVVVQSLENLAKAFEVDLSEYTSNIFSVVSIDIVREERFGDYTSTISLNKPLRALYGDKKFEFKNPYSFAKAIAHNIWSNKKNQQLLERVDANSPGFINFTLKNRALWKQLLSLHNNFESVCHLPKEQLHKIIFEYVSANPTGPLNIVSARAAALGDVCCNLLENVGHNVLREYYVNDYGNQVTLLGQSGMLRYLETQGCLLKFAQKQNQDDKALIYPNAPGLPFPSEGYHGEYITEIVQELIETQKINTINHGQMKTFQELSQNNDVSLDFLQENKLEEECINLGNTLISFLLEQQKQDLAAFNVSFNNYFLESQLHKENILSETQKKLSKHSYQQDKTIFFKSTDFGDDKDRVLVREDGRPTYFLADIAYHQDKVKRGFTHLYNIWGPDHHGYMARLKGAMQALNFSGTFKVFLAQQVNLLKEGKVLRMSKRSGNILKLRDLLEEVPLDVARYFFVMRSFEAPMDFDMDAAKDESDKNPYYYIAYAHARIRSIFRKVKSKGLQSLDPLEQESTLTTLDWTPQRRKLLFHLTRFPEEMQVAANDLEPHRVVHYLYFLANLFSQFYGLPENRIIQQDPRTASALLYLLETLAKCLKQGLHLLGTQAPERLLHEEVE